MDGRSDRMFANVFVVFLVLVAGACAWAALREAHRQTECARILCSNGVGAELLNNECICPVVPPGCPR
jgi:uncharacterized membrane protein